MAKPTTLAWHKLSLWVGDGASPVEDFTRISCGLTSHTFGITANMTEVDVPDCDLPDDPVWIERTVRNLASDIAGAGVLAVENFQDFLGWASGGVYKNCRVVFDLPVSPGYWASRYLLQRFETPATNEDGKIRVNLNFQSDGEGSWVAGAP